jgi:hypothetical protein
VDFRAAKLLDGRWWQRLNILTQALARKKNAQALDAGYRFYLAQVANGSLTEESFKKAQQSAQDAFHDYVGRLKPWQGKDFKDRKNREVTNYRQAYVDAFGFDPADPAFKEWEAKALEQYLKNLDQQNVQAAMNNPSAIIARRQAEREEQKRKVKRKAGK